jgi:hypothetical protein
MFLRISPVAAAGTSYGPYERDMFRMTVEIEI